MFSRSSLGRLSRDTGIVVVIVPWNAQLWVVCGVKRGLRVRVTHPRDCQRQSARFSRFSPRVSESHRMTQAYAAH